MKTHYLIIVLFSFLILLSCSNDDNEIITQNTKVKELIITYNGLENSSELVEIIYNSNSLIEKMLHVLGDDEFYETNFIYENNRLTLLETKVGNSRGNIDAVSYRISLEYDSDLITSSLHNDLLHSMLTSYEFKYNSSNQVIEQQEYRGDKSENIALEPYLIESYSYTNGNVTKKTREVLAFGESGSVTEHTFAYDNQPNPFFKLAGFQILGSSISVNEISVNNAISFTVQTSSYEETTSYTYHENGYPIESIRTNNDNDIIITTEYRYL